MADVKRLVRVHITVLHHDSILLGGAGLQELTVHDCGNERRGERRFVEDEVNVWADGDDLLDLLLTIQELVQLRYEVSGDSGRCFFQGAGSLEARDRDISVA